MGGDTDRGKDVAQVPAVGDGDAALMPSKWRFAFRCILLLWWGLFSAAFGWMPLLWLCCGVGSHAKCSQHTEKIDKSSTVFVILLLMRSRFQVEAAQSSA